MNKDLFIRFILGGAAVAISYMITVMSPWKILGGIFAAFPAVMITAVLMGGIAAGSKSAAKIANGSVFGMIGGVFCVATVWIVLKATNNWLLSIILGVIIWLFSSIIVAAIKERISLKPETSSAEVNHKSA
jgi:ABC-type transport system involved in Fe-S cluster assembly fused permease/ATPase subunit